MNAPIIRLTSLAHGGGCGCKLAPSVLQELLAGQPAAAPFRQLLVGADTGDEARRLFSSLQQQFLALVRARGYRLDLDATRPMYRFDIPDPFPPIELPAGFRVSSMAEDCDWSKINRVLWRGFNHPGEPPAEDVESRIQMSKTPNYDFSLKIVTVAPNEDYAPFSGLWYGPRVRFAYAEPAATDPTYRRMGLGKAAVLEGIRRCAQRGASVAYVGSNQAFYQAIGFRKVFDSQCWTRYLDE